MVDCRINSFAKVECKQSALQTIHFIGDSNTAGANVVNTGFVGGYRHPCYLALRQWRDNFDFIGTLCDALEGIGTFPLPFADGLSGRKIQDETAAFPAQVASVGAGDVIVSMLGTNNITNGDSAASMLALFKALVSEYRSVSPRSRIVVLGVLPFVAGTSVGGNLAAWNAVRVAFNASQQDWCGQLGVDYLSTDSLGDGDYQSDGIHLNAMGEAKLGNLVADHLNTVLADPSGYTLPRIQKQMKVWQSINCPSGGKASVAVSLGCNPEAGSIAYLVDYYPTLLDGAAFHSILTYNNNGGANGYFGLYQKGNALGLYWNGSNILETAATANSKCLTFGRWHRIAVVAFMNGAAGVIGLYVNAQLVGITTAVPAWTMLQHTFSVGTGPDFAGGPAFFSRVSAWKQSKGTMPAVPMPGSMACLRAVENDYYLQGALLDGSCSASFPLDADLADELGGNPLILAGGAAAAAAWPGGTPLRPWEYGQPGESLVALGGGAAPTLGTIGGQGPAAAAQDSWIRSYDSAGNAIWIPVWK